MKKFYLVLIILFSFNSHAQDVTLDDLRNLKAGFEKKYSITLFIEEIPFSIWELDYKIVTKEFYKDLYDYIKILDGEFSKYPIKFLWKTRLKAIALVRVLTINYQLRGAIPDYRREILFYDFFRGADFKTYQKHVIHHEFYHMIEQELNGNVAWEDPVWSQFNDLSFNYGKGGITMQKNANASVFSHPKAGFVNLYSQSAIEEDKAEIFATLFIKKEFKKLKRWAKKDKILKNKMDYMMNFLIQNNRKFNTSYWDNLNMNKTNKP